MASRLPLIWHQSIDAVCGAFIGIGAIIVGLRFYARRQQKANLRVDDWIMLPCYAFFLGMCICVLEGTQHKIIGWRDPSKIDQIRSRKFLILLLYSFDILSTLCYGFIKASALLFYLRIFCPHGIHQTFGAIILGGVIIVALWTCLFSIMMPLQCGTKFSASWSFNMVERQKYCSGSFRDGEAWVITDVILDFFILSLPMPSIWRLKMTTQRKIAITAIFLLALVGFAASIARMVIFIEVVTANSKGNKTPPSSNVNSQTVFWTVLSGGMCLTAVNLPSLWLFFSKGRVPDKVLHSIHSLVSLGSSTGSKGSKGSNNSSKKNTGFSAASGSSRQSQDREQLVDKFNPDAGGYEVHALRNKDDLESGSGSELPPVPPIGNILVKDTITQNTRHL